MRLGSLPRLSTSARRATGGLALFGGLIGTSSLKVTIHSLHSLDSSHHSCLDTSGPFVDAVHNQALLEYDVFPLTLGLAHTSWIVPPLLALAYSMLGALLPSLLEAAMGHGGFEPLIAVSSTMPRSSGRRAGEVFVRSAAKSAHTARRRRAPRRTSQRRLRSPRTAYMTSSSPASPGGSRPGAPGPKVTGPAARSSTTRLSAAAPATATSTRAATRSPARMRCGTATVQLMRTAAAALHARRAALIMCYCEQPGQPESLDFAVAWRMDAACTSILIGESQTPAKSCRTPACPAC